MPSATAVVESINAVLAAEGMAKQFLDQFSYSMQVEILNGEVNKAGNLTHNGFSNLMSCADAIHTSDHDQFIVDSSAHPPIDLTPPFFDTKVPEKDGYMVGLEGAALRGAYLVYPIQLPAMYFHVPNDAIYKQTVWYETKLKAPKALQHLGWTNVARVYPTVFLNLYNGYGNDHYLVQPSYFLAAQEFEPGHERSVATLSKLIFEQLYEDDAILGKKSEETASTVIEPGTLPFELAGLPYPQGNYPLMAAVTGGAYHEELDKPGGRIRKYFLDAEGNRCMPYIRCNAVKDKRLPDVMDVEVTFRRDLTQAALR